MAEYSRAEAERLVRFCRDAENAISAVISTRKQRISPREMP